MPFPQLRQTAGGRLEEPAQERPPPPAPGRDGNPVHRAENTTRNTRCRTANKVRGTFRKRGAACLQVPLSRRRSTKPAPSTTSQPSSSVTQGQRVYSRLATDGTGAGSRALWSLLAVITRRPHARWLLLLLRLGQKPIQVVNHADLALGERDGEAFTPAAWEELEVAQRAERAAHEKMNAADAAYLQARRP